MRARYYSPDMRRFVNADVLPWIFWGNSPEDTTTMLERLDAFLVDGIQDGSIDLIGKLFHD